ncbi:ACP S-malonyltransferase [Paenisporosarcina sp. FSL H8-0542]|uniref:ACP S-malonyltransferase n=1 Tax=unclassified Paenisporosarcina TaxID=2642018 RepID=UPI00034E68DD|nr:ACP S-malonyltransferase [Paenisporosarcina sp. HGH0030]EPD52826.1 malonyl CoA-acyl carrier protein transacylase [Paenisporosarcina sp. HGH0030]
MTKIAFIFPGQGSQAIGMGNELVQSNTGNKAFYDKADEQLGFSLSTLMLEGPVEELTYTYNAQPALLTTSTMVSELLQAAGLKPDYTIGHSLGEYSALVASGVMSFEDGVKIVHQRGLFMNEAVPAGLGAMAAILGMEADALKMVTDQVTAEGEVVQLANLNCPGQIVISGTKAGVEKACLQAKEAGAKRAIPLVVSGPFHSELMRPAASKLENALNELDMHNTDVPVISNVTAGPVTSAEEMKQLLVEQLYSPVRFEESIRALLDLGVNTFIECGPGKVLSGLVKKIDRSAVVYAAYDNETVEQVIEAAKEWA